MVPEHQRNPGYGSVITMELNNRLVISMVPIHSGRPWAYCNLYTSDAFKMPMAFL